MKYFSLRVINIHQETADTATICFKQPGLKPIKYLAGQYLSLIFRINNRRYVRPYSFCSAPDVDKTLNITVKRVPGGIVSNHIIDKLKVDDIVEVMEPMGDFVLQTDIDQNRVCLFLWGAGSGITPLISLAKYTLHHKKAKSVKLIYGNRSFESIIFRDEIASLKKTYDQSFDVSHFITNPFVDEATPFVVSGRITQENVRSIISQQSKEDQCLHYICGPAGLKESVKSVLQEAGFENNHIFTEDFEVYRNPKDFENIRTQTISLIKEGEIKRVEVASGKSILEAGLDALIDLSYSCQTGNCLVCKGKIVKGEIKMIGVEKIPELLGKDECLLCSSFPLTDDVEIIVEQ
jgi:ring-1,2-phenylacetyl-CoA epoxidase subunit PaaE